MKMEEGKEIRNKIVHSLQKEGWKMRQVSECLVSGA
jgi:hypothetical protein